jgi:hypothetical protein
MATSKRPVPDWQVQLIWFLASIFATGALWYFLSRDEILLAVMSMFAATALAAVAVALHRLNDRSARFKFHRENLARFLGEAEHLLHSYSGQRLPADATHAWAARVETYLREQLDSSYIARFRNFSGMVFFSGSGSERNAIDGHSRRLHEFIKEFGE